MFKPVDIETQSLKLTQPFDDALLNQGIQLCIRREDNIHSFASNKFVSNKAFGNKVSGNKYRKLIYNLLKAQTQKQQQVLTFGGAYSNHIAATACAAQALGLKSIGVIRGDELQTLFKEDKNAFLAQNPTLAVADDMGMRFYFVSRKKYRHKHEADFIKHLKNTFGDCYVIPEGGTNALAVKGCEEIISHQDIQDYDVICCAVGTGGTIAGLINQLQHYHLQNQTNFLSLPCQILGFSALNVAKSLTASPTTKPKLLTDINALIDQKHAMKVDRHWQVNFDFTFGGYAKVTDDLVAFINQFKAHHQIPLDPIYTGKMLYGIYTLAKQGYFNKKHTRILAIHTGGLQGIAGINQRLQKQGKTLINTD